MSEDITDADAPLYSRNDIRRIASALIQVPHTGDIEFESGAAPSEPTPDLLVDMLTQLRDILRARMPPELTSVERAVWDAWNALPPTEMSPVKRIAEKLGMATSDVAFVVYPAEDFGRWEDSREPDLSDTGLTCDSCSEPAEVTLGTPDNDPRPMCAYHLARLAVDLLGDRDE